MAMPLKKTALARAQPPAVVPRFSLYKGGDVADLLKFCNYLHKELYAIQEKWRPVFYDIADYVVPGMGYFPERKRSNEGDRKDMLVIDRAAKLALFVLAAGIHEGLTSQTRPWLRYGLVDPELSDWHPARMWLDETLRIDMAVLAQSNLYNCLHKSYLGDASFGTNVFYVGEDFDDVMFGRDFSCGTYAIGVDHRGVVDRIAFKLRKSVYNAAKEFGYENLSDKVKAQYDKGHYHGWVDIKCVVYPNDSHKPDSPLSIHLPVKCVYWEEGCTDQVLKVGGYHEFPYIASRWDVEGDDYYGRGPGWDMLGDAKQLQVQHEDKLTLSAKIGDPPLLADEDMAHRPINTAPGGVTYASAALGAKPGESSVRPLYEVKGAVDNLVALIEDVRASIRRTGYTDAFLMLSGGEHPQMTAEEVIERRSEKMTMIGPVINRQIYEKLDKFVSRVYSICDRAGLHPPPPKEIAGMPLKTEYISVLAQAQKLRGVAPLSQFSAFVGNVAAIWPEARYKAKPLELVDQYADLVQAPPSVVRSDEEAMAMIEAEQKKSQAMEQAAMMQAAAQGAETLSKANTGPGNLLSNIMGGMGGGD